MPLKVKRTPRPEWFWVTVFIIWLLIITWWLTFDRMGR